MNWKLKVTAQGCLNRIFVDLRTLFMVQCLFTVYQMRRFDATYASEVQSLNTVASTPSFPVGAPVPTCSQQGPLFGRQQRQRSHKVLVSKPTAVQTLSDSVSNSERLKPYRVRSLGLFELTFFGCHLTTLSSPYRSASIDILAGSNTWNFDLSVNLPRFSSAGCWNGFRPYKSACGEAEDCFDPVVRMAIDACRSTIRFPDHASMMACFRTEQPSYPRMPIGHYILSAPDQSSYALQQAT